jgi:hypothetical protein
LATSNKEAAIVPFNLSESSDQHKTPDGKSNYEREYWLREARNFKTRGAGAFLSSSLQLLRSLLVY